MYQVRLTKYAIEDYSKLDGSEQHQILKEFKRIEQHGMTAGEQLRGELNNSQKIKLRDAGFRIAFHQDIGRVEIIQIIAIGKRGKPKGYKNTFKLVK